MQDPFADLLPNAQPTRGVVLPTNQTEVDQAEADLGNTQSTIADRAADNERADKKLEAELFERGLRIGSNGQVERIPGWTPPTKASAPVDPMKLAQFEVLDAQIARVEELYRSGIGKTKGAMGLQDYLPTGANAAFDSAAAAMAEAGLAAFRVPGVGAQSDNELRQFVEANRPSAWDRDEAIEEKLRNLRNRVRITKQYVGIEPKQSSELVSAFEIPRLQNIQQETEAGGFGAETQTLPIPPEMQQAYNDFVAKGDFTPESYAAFRMGLDQRFFPDATQTQADVYKAEGQRILEGIQANRTQNLAIERPEVPLSARDKRRNNLANSVGVPAFVSGANALSIGAIEAFAPDQLQAMRGANPIQSLAGDVVGGIGGVTALGRVGANAAARVAPNLLRGGETAAFGRNLAADATYGGIYGGVTGQNPLLTSALSATGSAVGQTLGKGAGAAVGGVNVSPQVQALRDRGVRLTTGRQLGSTASRVEDALQSLPVVGDTIRGRQLDSFKDFNKGAFNIGAEAIGETIDDTGRDALEAFDGAVGSSYRDALRGRSVPVDRNLTDDLAPAAAARGELPDDLLPRTDRLIENHLGPIGESGQITGEAYQRARRGLGRARKNANQIAGEFDEPYRDTMTGVLEALDAQLARTGGDDVIEGLNAANKANKNLRVLEDASLDAAKIGTQTGEANIFTPAQLLAASRKSEKRFGGGAELREFGEQGQAILPSRLPNSGTTDRALLAAALGLGGAGGVEAYAREDAPMATAGAVGLGALLALGGTRTGQGVINNMVFNRPRVASRIGDAMRRRRGMFGSGIAVPMVTAD